MRMKSKAQHSNLTGMKRRVGLESEAKLSKVKSPSKRNKVPLKGDLIEELRELKEKYFALEEKSKKDIRVLEIENKMLKDTNKKFSDEVKSHIERLQNLEAENLSISKVTKTKDFR